MKLASAGLVLLAAAATAQTAEFTATVVKSEGKARVSTGTIHVKGDLYRLAFANPRGPDAVSISDPTNDVVRVLVPRYGLYMEDSLQSSLAQMNDPFLMPAMLREYYESKDVGTETIAGYECKKETLGTGDQVAATIWTSAKLGFLLKILVSEEQAHWVELRDVKETAVADELFAIPEGFTKADRETIAKRIEADSEMQAKEEQWQRNRPRRKSVTKRIAAGSELKILVGNATEVTVGLKYDAPECRWFVEAFRDGATLLAPTPEPLVGKVAVELPAGEVPDLVVARCVEGEGFLGVDLTGKLPLVLATKTASIKSAMGGPSWSLDPACRKVSVRFTVAADATGNMKAAFSYGDGQGNTQNETFTLAPGESKTFELDPQDGVSDVGYSVMVGTATVEVLEDMRPPEEQKPF